jgi:hypothetical protein
VSSTATLNPTLPEDLVSAALDGLTEHLGDIAGVLRIRVGVNHSFDNGPDFNPKVTVRYADGTTGTVDLDRTLFRDMLIERRDDLDDIGEQLHPFSIRVQADPPAPAEEDRPSLQEAAYLEAAQRGTLVTRCYRSLRRGAEDPSSHPVVRLAPLPSARLLDLGWLRYAEHGFGLAITEQGRAALAEYRRSGSRPLIPRHVTRIARALGRVLATQTTRMRTASTRLSLVEIVGHAARVLRAMTEPRTSDQQGGRHR